MNRLMCLIPVLAILLACGPFRGQDAAELEPLEILYLSRDPAGYCFRGDTGCVGSGGSVEAALADLHARASGAIFLETADYLLLEPGLQGQLSELRDILRPGCRICLVRGEPQLEKLRAYLHTHEPDRTLSEYQAGMTRLPVLNFRGGEPHFEP